MNLQLHHVGCLVEAMEPAIASYKALLGPDINVSEAITISEQAVAVCFIETAPQVYIELVCPLDPTSRLAKMQTKKGISFYHLAYQTPDMDATLAQLEASGYRLVTRFQSEAFEGRQCCFVYTPELHLIELIESK